MWKVCKNMEYCGEIHAFYRDVTSLMELFYKLVGFFQLNETFRFHSWLWDLCFFLVFLVKYHYYSLQDEKVKIRNFAKEIMPEQYDDGWQQKLWMVEKLVAEIRPFMPRIMGIYILCVSFFFLLSVVYFVMLCPVHCGFVCKCRKSDQDWD